MEDPVTPAPAGNESPNPAAAQATPQEPAASASDKVPDQKPSEPPEQEHDWKARFDGTSQAHKQLSEEHQQVIDTNVKLVEKNPGLLNDLAASNPKLADQVSKKLYDKDYSTYQKDQELEALKNSDPDRYAQEKRISKIEERDAQRTEAERKAFLQSKGIKDNEFDPAYQKVKKELETLSPQYVEDNPTQAWEKAYQLAYPSSSDPQADKVAADLAGNTSRKGGLSAMLDHRPSKLTPEAQAFKDKMSTLTGK